MTAYSPDGVFSGADPFPAVAATLLAVLGGAETGPEIGSEIGPDVRLEGDLRMDSLELARFGQRLADRFGDQVDFGRLLAGLPFDELIELTVGQVSEYIAGRSVSRSASRLGSR